MRSVSTAACPAHRINMLRTVQQTCRRAGYFPRPPLPLQAPLKQQQQLLAHGASQPHRLWTRDSVRCLASYNRSGKPDEKSWGELAGEAAEVARGILGKVGKGISKAVTAIVPASQPEDKPRQWEDRQRSRADIRPVEPVFGGGIVGNMLGKMLNYGLNSIMEQVAGSQKEVAALQERVARAIEADRRVMDQLGARISVGAPVSMSSMSSNINGRQSKQISMQLPVSGAAGMAYAQVQYVEGAQEDESLDIRVRLPTGRDIVIDTRGGGAGGFKAGTVVDVDWKEIR